MSRTQLYENHISKGAKCVEFGGFELPVWFSSLKEEHNAVRKKAGCFDISHMGLFLIEGPNAFDLLQLINCNDVNKSVPGKMVYSMILNESGGILDDVMFGNLDKKKFILVVNAGNREKIKEWISKQNKEVDVTELNDKMSFIAVQGPEALKLSVQALKMPFTTMSRFSVQELVYKGQNCLVMRTGYTGEDGFEIAVPHDSVDGVWDELLKVGIQPCGLGARDSLRLEAGLPLYGQEFDEKVNPLMTRYPWVVAWDKDFIGKEALESYKNAQAEWVTVGFEMMERGIPRSHYAVLEGGEVTSGTLSPSLNKAVGMARVRPNLSQVGTEIHIDIRKQACKAKVVKLPFQ